MKYNNLHHTKPTPNIPVYFVSPEAKEVLGTFIPNLGFNATEGKLRGYMAKWWRYLTDIELQSIAPIEVQIVEKRKYVKKSPDEVRQKRKYVKKIR